MPLKFDMVRGRPALMSLRQIGTSRVAPATVTVTVDSAGAPAGVTPNTCSPKSRRISGRRFSRHCSGVVTGVPSSIFSGSGSVNAGIFDSS